LVRFHERADTAVHRSYDLVFALLHLRKIDTCVFDDNAVLPGFLFCEHEMIARSEQRLAWDAANIETGAAQIFVFFENGRLQSELAGTNRGDVAARSGANDNDVKFFHMVFLSFRPKWRNLLLLSIL